METPLNSLYPQVFDCFALEKQINILKQDIDYYRKRFNRREGDDREVILKEREEYFYVLSCPATIEFKRQSETKAIFDEKATAAKTRIETDSYKSRNILAGISIIILISGLLVILNNKK